MILTFMLYACVTGSMIALVGWLGERAIQSLGAPVRWIWLGAIGASVGLLTLAAFFYALPQPSAATIRSEIAQPAVGLDQAVKSTGQSSGSHPRPAKWWLAQRTKATAWLESSPTLQSIRARADEWNTQVAWAWALTSLLLVATLMFNTWAGSRDRHRHREERMFDGITAQITRSEGPAAIGVRRPVIVLPAWVLELDPVLRSLVIRHEQEHIEARDPAVLLVITLLVVLIPWHLPLWWCLSRLRLAIEMDCDARVLRDHPDVRRYARLLLLVRQHLEVLPRDRARWAVAAATLQPSPYFLRRRIVAMTHSTSRHPRRVAAFLLTCCTATATLALALPGPGRTITQRLGPWHWTIGRPLSPTPAGTSLPRATIRGDAGKVRIDVAFNNPCHYPVGTQYRKSDKSVDIRFFDQSRPQSERDALDTTCPRISNVVAYETVVAGLKPGRYTVNVFMGRGSPDPSPASAIASETIELKPYRVYATAIVSPHFHARGLSHVLVFTSDSALLAAGDSAYSLSPDTVKLAAPASVRADLTEGEVHFLGDVPLDVIATITNGPALSVTGTGRHIVLVRGGVGIDIKKD